MNVIIDERKENAMTFNKVLLSWIVILIITTSIYLFWQLGDINDVFNQSILINVRLPRLLEALLTGMILTVAGLIFQTVLNNALADSFTLGIGKRRHIWFRISIIFRFNNVMDSCIFNNI